MTIKQDVLDLHQRHPDWSSDKIATFLGAKPSSVRSVALRGKFALAPKNTLTVKRRHRRAPYAGKQAGQGEW